jgi:hypothetical protein
MDFDRYFIIHEQDWQDADESSSESEDSWAPTHQISHQTCRTQICNEDRVTDYISNLHSNRHHPQMDEHVTKPLPPVPEELEAGSLPVLTGQRALPSRRQPRIGRATVAGTNERATSYHDSSASERSASPLNDRRLSLWPKAHASDMRKAGQTSAIILQRHIDSSFHPNFESLDSKESCDLDQWANDVYGPQDSAMSSLRDQRRGVFPRISTKARRRESIPETAGSPVCRPSQARTYCPSTSAGSYTDHERTSCYSPSDMLSDYSERGRSEDTNATSFFDSSDEDEESECTMEKRSPAKKFWQKMASSLRPTKSNASMRRLGTPSIDLRPAKSNTSMRGSGMPSIDLRLARSNTPTRRSGIPFD